MELPVDTLRSAFLAAVEESAVVISAPTGSGKSTRVPTWCVRDEKRVLVVEPRRVACRSLARFVASTMDSELGALVGYRHRHEDRSGRCTRILFATPGTALRMFHTDGLSGFSTVILDEFHERHVHVDLLCALVRASAVTRLVVMSATVDASWLAGRIGGTALECDGRLHPVSVEYDPAVSVPTHRDLPERMARTVRRALEFPGDVLVFLPGKGEIASVSKALGDLHGIQVLPLHGELDVRGQDRVFEPDQQRRVILSTNVAESAVTLPGIGVVVDSGLERRTVFRDGRSVLELCVISRDSADQRAGRAGRLGPGVALRCWSEASRLEERAVPEIHRVDLADLVMNVVQAGIHPRELDLVDPPREYALDEAIGDLSALGAIDARQEITDTGRAMMQFAMDPRLAKLLVQARQMDSAALLQDMVDLVASLQGDRDLFLRERDGARFPGREDYEEARCDLFARVHALRHGIASHHGLRTQVLTEARKVAGRLRRQLGIASTQPDGIQPRDLARAVLEAWPHSGFVPHRRQGAFGNGRREVILGRESFAPSSARALVVVQRRSIKKGRRTVTIATCASPVDPAMLAGAGHGTERLVDVGRQGARFVGTLETRLCDRLLDRAERVLSQHRVSEAAAMLIERGEILAGVFQTIVDDVEAFRLDRRLAGEVVEDVDARQWLVERLRRLGVRSAEDLDLVDAADLRFDRIDAKRKEVLDREFPRTIAMQGRTMRVSYDPAARVVTLENLSGNGRSAPSDILLPPWPGYKVLYVDRGRTTRVR